MSTARPFAYNIGAPITGTDQVGGLAVGTPTAGFSATGLQWWNGPDEDLGYVIAQSVPSNTQPVPVGTGATGASVGFFRSSALTDPSFISIANAVAGPSGGGPFASGSAAKTWLNSNGYWTSYAGGTGAGWLFYYAEGSIGSTPPPVNNGDVIFYNQSNATITYNPNYPGGGANFNLYFNVNQADGTSYLTQFNALVASGGTVAMSQGSNTAIYSGPNTAYNITNFGSGNVLVISGLGATLIQAASTPFVSGTPITVVVS